MLVWLLSLDLGLLLALRLWLLLRLALLLWLPLLPCLLLSLGAGLTLLLFFMLLALPVTLLRSLVLLPGRSLLLLLLSLVLLLLLLSLVLLPGLLPLVILLTRPVGLLLFVLLPLALLFPVCRLVFAFGSLSCFSGVYGLLVKDLIYQILFFEEFYPLNFELLGNLPQFGNQHFAQFKNIMHVVKCVEN